MTRIRRAIGAGALTLVMACSGAALISAAPGGALTPAGVPLDHFLCYPAVAQKGTAAPPFMMPFGLLVNQFAPNGFGFQSTTVTQHCNPVEKTVTIPPTPLNPGSSVDTPINNPVGHLLCFKLKVNAVPVQFPYTVLIVNQFAPNGAVLKTTGPPNQLCLPTWKTLTPPSVPGPAPGPPLLDHYVCYPVAYATTPPTSVFAPPAGSVVTLRDQFEPAGTPPYTAKVTTTPTTLCLPSSKNIGGAATGIQDPVDHLLCLKISVKPATVLPPIWDQNQFGSGQIALRPANSLCLPSQKTVLSGP